MSEKKRETGKRLISAINTMDASERAYMLAYAEGMAKHAEIMAQEGIDKDGHKTTKA